MGHSGEAVTRTHYRAKATEATDMATVLAGYWESNEENQS